MQHLLSIFSTTYNECRPSFVCCLGKQSQFIFYDDFDRVWYETTLLESSCDLSFLKKRAAKAALIQSDL